MKYIIHCLLHEPFKSYHRNLVDQIAEEFDLTFTKQQGLYPHFTLKYDFETDDIDYVENAVENFVKSYKKAPITIGGFGCFGDWVVYINVNLSDEAKKLFNEFIREIKSFSWMTWNQYDAENMHFHSTIAENCESKIKEVQKFLEGKEKYFDCLFDNIAILRRVGMIEGIEKWDVHKIYNFN